MFSLNLLISDADMLQILMILTSLTPTLETPQKRGGGISNDLEKPQKPKTASN